MISSLARPATPLKTRRRRTDGTVIQLDLRPMGLVGLCVHTTGSSIVEQAEKAGANVLEHCVAYYLKPENYFPNYVCGWRGWRGLELVQICDENRIALHAGFTTGDAAMYTEGIWRKRIDARRWDIAWGKTYRNPMKIYPQSTPNRAFIGLELPPLPAPRDGGLRYTDEQHETVADLAADILARYGLPAERRRVVGHEDVNPVARWSAGGGWDPGARRARPWFDWQAVYQRMGLPEREPEKNA